MSSHEIHSLGVDLEFIVGRLKAKLQGPKAYNRADYYDYGKGIYDGAAACVEALQGRVVARRNDSPGSPGARLGVFLDRAAEKLRSLHAAKKDPDTAKEFTAAVVALVGAVEAALDLR